MARMEEEYKGYELWFYEEGEKTSKSVWIAKPKAKMPEIGWRNTKEALKKQIDETLKQVTKKPEKRKKRKREKEKVKQPPKKIEDYKGVEIYQIVKSGMYKATIEKHSKRSKNIEKIKKWIDKEKK